MARVTVSTHVLDTAFGKPRARMQVVLYRGTEEIARAETDDDGRVKSLAKDLAPGTYRLAFVVGGPFIEELSVSVRLEDGSYHVPVLLSPFGATIYRGS